ncbi:MAG: alpha/beta hydrolase [Bacteroidota bacterium]
MRRLKKIGVALFVIYMSIAALLYTLQEKFIFLPRQLEQGYPYSFDEPFEEFFLEAKDGAKLNALHFRRTAPQGVLLYFHGNAGDLSRWGEIAIYFVKKNYDVIIMDYRTYGKSSGDLSEEGLFSDAQLFYEYALKSYEERDIIVYGRSLGAAIATELASNRNPKKLILETPFYNLIDVAQNRFPWLPIKQLLKYRFESNRYIKKVGCPVSIFHGTEDSVVPYESGQKLFDAIEHGQKRWYRIENGEHNNLIEFSTFHEGIHTELNQTD